jgi:hypothetical protein
MGRQEELKALNTPTGGKQFKFYLGDRLYDCVILDLVDVGQFSGDYMSFTIVTPDGNYQLRSLLEVDSTNESLFEGLEIYYPVDITGLDTDYFNVIYYLNKIYILFKVDGFEFIPDFDETAMTDTEGTYQVTVQLKYAPDGWDSDEFTLIRDLKSFGVFRKFATGELKFVKDGRDNILNSYEATGVNTDKTLTVTETTSFGLVRTRFVGKIDHSTLKRTEISTDVAVIDGSFTDLVLSRANMDVNLLGVKSVDGQTISSLTLQNIIRPEIRLTQFCNWTSGTGTITKTASHILPTAIEASEFEEAEATDEFSLYMFLDAEKDYLQATLDVNIKAVATGNNSSAYFSWEIKCDRYSGGVYMNNIFSENVICEGVTTNILINKSETIDLLEGESIKIYAVYTPSIGSGNIVYDAFEGITYKFSYLMANYPQSLVKGVFYHEAFERLIQIYTGNSGRFKSDFFGRTDLGYSADGVIGSIATGRNFNGANFWNETLATSLSSLFTSLQSVYNLGMGVETIGGVEKVVVEPMSYFFSDQVLLNVSDRIAAETIEKEYYPELSFNRIAVGFNSYEYKSLGGIYEFNTTSKFTAPIKPVDKELNIVSPIRADMAGILLCLELGGTNYDSEELSDVFIFDTIREGSDFIIRTSEGFESVSNITNRDTLFNLLLSPERNLIRWGAFIRGFTEKDKTKYLLWQTSDKNTRLKSTLTGGTEVAENSDVLISSLADPLWHPEILTFEVPALETDIDVIQENKYGLIQCSDTEYGWIINYKSKNENKKSEFTLLRCNTDFVTPVGDPVYPTTITIKKVVTGAVVDYTTFGVNLIGDNGIEYLNLPIQNGEFGKIELSGIPYGTYTVTENTETGYTLTSISPSEITIDKDNLHFDLEIVNAKLTEALELTFDNIANVPVADASSVSDWNTFFDLPTYGTEFSSVQVVDNVVKLYGGSGITLKTYLFADSSYVTHLVKFIDNSGSVLTCNASVFAESTCVEIYLPELTTVYDYVFANATGLILTATKIKDVLGLGVFAGMINQDTFNLPLLENLTESCFNGCTATTYNLQSLLNMGETVGDNLVFDSVSGQTITLTIPAALMTCNGGNPDGDIQYLQANNTVTIVTV